MKSICILLPLVLYLSCLCNGALYPVVGVFFLLSCFSFSFSFSFTFFFFHFLSLCLSLFLNVLFPVSFLLSLFIFFSFSTVWFTSHIMNFFIPSFIFIPLLPLCDLGKNILEPSIYEYEQASKLRVTTATSTIDKSYLDTGSETTDAARTYARSLGLPTDDAGHILANRLGGSGKDPVNIFPQNLSINRGSWRVFEGRIFDCLIETPAQIIAALDWTFTYSGDETRATSIIYCVKYSATPNCSSSDVCQTFANPV